MEYSHRPSPYFSFLSKLANRNAVLEAIFRVPTEASSNPLAWSIRTLHGPHTERTVRPFPPTFRYKMTLNCFCILVVKENACTLSQNLYCLQWQQPSTSKLWQPSVSRSATSLKAAKAEKCENSLHILSPLLAGRGSKIVATVALSEELKVKKRLLAESG